MKIQTLKLQSLVNKSLKGAGLNKLIPITSFIGMKAIILDEKPVLEFITTDMTNYLYLYDYDVEIDKDFYAVVEAEQFGRLVSKLTCEKTEISVTDVNLHVKGNGDYDIPLQFDETGSLVKYPDPTLNVVWNKVGETKLSTLLNILNYCRSSLALTTELPVYTNYYLADKVIATDTTKISQLGESVFNEPHLISSKMMDLLGIVESENIQILKESSDSFISFNTPEVTITGNIVKGIEDYQIDAIENLLVQKYPSSCKVDKKSFYDTLDRISLFIDVYDNGGIRLIFTNDSILVENVKTTGVEEVKVQPITFEGEFTCMIPSDSLMSILKALPDGLIEIQYGESNAVKLIVDNVVQVIALLEE